jgi:hypothetical protein
MAFVMTALSWGLLSYREGYEAAGDYKNFNITYHAEPK